MKYFFGIIILIIFLSCSKKISDRDFNFQNLYYLLLYSNDSTQYTQTYSMKSIYPLEKKMNGGLLFDPNSDSTAFELSTTNKTDTFSFTYSRKIDEYNFYLSFDNIKYHSKNNLKYAIEKIDTFRGYSYTPFITFYMP